jgi:thiamine pyrophosphate-dependent acetolactate synthase large subunit-like protein
VFGTEFATRADFAGLAKSLNAEGLRVEKASQMGDALQWALKCGKPCVLDCIVKEDPVLPKFAGTFYTPGRPSAPPLPRGSRRELSV